jgi:hypothetical protein
MATFTVEEWTSRFIRVGVPAEDAQVYGTLFVDNEMPKDLSLLDRDAIYAMGVKKMGHVLLIMKLRPQQTLAPAPVAPQMKGSVAQQERMPLITVRAAVHTPCRNHKDREATQICADCSGQFCLQCCARVAGQNNISLVVCRKCAEENCCHGPSSCLLL